MDKTDILAVREAVRFTTDFYSVQKEGPLGVMISTYCYLGHPKFDTGISHRKDKGVPPTEAKI